MLIAGKRFYVSPLRNTMPSAAQATGNRHVRHLAWHATRYRRIQVIVIRTFVQAHGNAVKTPFHGVARDRVANSFGNGQADTAALHRRCIARYDIVVHQIMHDDVFSRYPTTAFEHRNKIAMAFQPFHRSMPLKNQAARDLRPLARRRLIRARPARVRMR